jgi:hypothetical protein
MGFNLDSMVGTYKDFARGYLFYAKVTGKGGSFDKDHPYLVNSTTLPAQSIEPITTNWQGNEYKIGGVNSFSDFPITFKSDVKQDLRAQFLKWAQLIHDPVTNVHGNPNDYFGQVDLTQIDVNGEGVMSYSLINAWPSGIGEITLDYGNKEISTFDVTFTYQYHVVENIFGGVTATPASV